MDTNSGDTERARRATTAIDFAALVDNLPIGVFVIDAEGEPCYANPAAVELLGQGIGTATPDELSTIYDAYLLGTNHPYPMEQMPVVRALQGETSIVDDMEIRRSDGSVVLQVWGTPMVDAVSGVRYAIAAFTDVTKRKQAERALLETEREARERALTDELTGLANRRGLIHVMEALVRLAARKQNRLTLIYIDLDHLKDINDSLGHEEGDRALIEVAEILRTTFRDSDFLARIGGDEFCVVMTNAEADPGVVLDRLEHAISARNEAGDGRPALSFSMGVAHFDPRRPSSLQELMAEADRKMYENKARRKSAAGDR